MTHEIKLLAALRQAESLSQVTGFSVEQVLRNSAVMHRIDANELAVAWLRKLVARDQARRALADEARRQQNEERMPGGQI